jgi:hypothetical protein
MNIRQVYDNLRKGLEKNGQPIDEAKLRQQAWVLRDKMIFESSFNNSNIWNRI